MIFRRFITCLIICLNIYFIVFSDTAVFAASPAYQGLSKYDKIRVVMDDNYPPYIFRNENGELNGILTDQWKLWEHKTGIKVEITATDWNLAQSLMENGDYDVIDTIFINEDRVNLYDFSKPYATIQVPIFFHKNISGITGIESLKGFKVGVKRGDNSETVLRNNGITNLVTFDNYEAIIKQAKEQNIMIFVMDQPPALYFTYKYGIQKQFNYSEPLYSGEFHRAVRKGNIDLLKVIEEGFSKISKKEYDRINGKWFGKSEIDSNILKYSIISLLTFGFILLILITWNRTLNRIVKQKTYALTDALRQLRTSEENYKRLLSNLSIGVIVFSNSDEILLYNKAFLMMTGLEENQIKEKSTDFEYAKIFIKSDGSKIKDEDLPSRKVMKTGKAVGDKTIGVINRKNNKIIWVKADAIPVYDNDNQVKEIIVTLVDITARKKAEELICEMSIKDILTGVYNRNYFENEIKKLATQKKAGIGIVLCDVDGLKLVNDTMGHAVGDEYLKTVTKVLCSCFREQDIIARIGGDEFAVLLKDITENEMRRIKLDVYEKIKNLNYDINMIPASISFGYEISSSEDVDLDQLFKGADDYMYREKIHHRQSAKSKNIEILTKMMEVRDFYTEGHGKRMQEMSVKLAEKVGLEGAKLKDIYLLAQFHDIGKVGIPDAILFKNGRLNEEELNIIRRHPEIGHRIAEASPDLRHISEWIYRHHEWWNGGGYPFGLKGREIPLECRIISIVDAYDAMTSNRPYRKAMDKERAIDEIKRCSGTQFDPELVDLFIEIIE